jgi:mRNA interferase RelE/StbE
VPISTKLLPEYLYLLHNWDAPARSRIIQYLKEQVAVQSNPRILGRGLKGNKQGLWRYRVGNYRIICEILDTRTIVLVVKVGSRQSVYD